MVRWRAAFRRTVVFVVLCGVAGALGVSPARAGGPCAGDGAIVKAIDVGQDEAARVYYLLRGRRWLVASESVFWSLDLSFADVCNMPQGQLDAIPRGPDVGFDGGLFLCPECPAPTAVYRIEDGRRRHIANAFVLHQCLGLSDDDIFTAATPAYQDIFPEDWELEADCDPDSVAVDSCGDCGQRRRTCEATCTWSAWSACTGEGDCSGAPASPEPVTLDPEGCSGGPGPAGAWMALGLAAAAVLRPRRRRRG